jgi:acyl carrier protein
MNSKNLTKEDIQKWLTNAVATELKIDESKIDLDSDIADHGLDSLASASIVVRLEGLVGMGLPATLLWDYPTVNEISSFIENCIRNNDTEE